VYSIVSSTLFLMITNNTSTVFYTVLLPNTYEGYMLKLHERHNKFTEVMGFCCHKNGDTTYAERRNLIRNKGDIVVAVNGQDVFGKSSKDIEDIINCVEVSVTLCLIDIVSTPYLIDTGGKNDQWGRRVVSL
jgi:hypothetical protein